MNKRMTIAKYLGVFSVVCAAISGWAESLAFVGTTDKNPLDYHVGERMDFTIRLVDRDAGCRSVTGRRIVWVRTGDDGRTERGETLSSALPFVVRTRSDKPGFVRVTVHVKDAQNRNVRDAKANHDVCWDGGAGADVDAIPAQPLPSDFDTFWDRELAQLRATDCTPTLIELPAKEPRAYYAKFSIPMPNGERPATGLVAYPKDAKAHSMPLLVRVTGYGFGASKIDTYHAIHGNGQKGQIIVDITRHGEDPCESKDYYMNLQTNVMKNFCFRNNDRRIQDTDYYKMLMRDLKAVQWAKTLPMWNGKDLKTTGGSMGGYQALGIAALDASVTKVNAFIPWSQDFAGPSKFKRMGGWFPGWTKVLDYVSGEHLATRVRASVEMTIGLGDYICPPSGEMLLFRNLKGKKKLTCKQNMGHGSIYGPDVDVFAYPCAQVESLDGAWEFRKEGEKEWSRVTVPHDWAIAGPFEPKSSGWQGKLPWRGAGEYRRHFSLPERSAAHDEAPHWYLEFDGVMARPEVFLNGQRVGGWNYGYMSFSLDVSRFVRPGDNELRVTCSTKDHASRWYPGAGIYRSVRLVGRPSDHVVPGSLAVMTQDVSTNAATVTVSYVSFRDGPKREVKTVKSPRLWDVESPNLYTLDLLGEKFTYGIRSFAFKADEGFFLNGRRVQLKGVDLHSDLGPIGMAFDRDAMKRQLLLMKDMGFNALRTSHNAPDPHVLDLCDELGVFVWDECFDKWQGTAGRRRDENLEAYVTENLRQFVRRDRNHPSVFVWSVGNEVWPYHTKDRDGYTGMTPARHALFVAAVKSEDATRPVGVGCCHGDSVKGIPGLYDAFDITGWNYGESYNVMRKVYPTKPVLYSESASAVSEYGYYEQPLARNKEAYSRDVLQVGSYDHCAAPWSDIPDVEFARMERDRHCGGEFVWTGIDYLGEPTPIANGKHFGIHTNEESLARSSYFGIADLCGLPKDRWYLYRAHWNESVPTCHILPHWNWDAAVTRKLPVFVYATGDTVELFLNGRSLGRKSRGVVEPTPGCSTPYYDVCARYRFRWFDVPYEPGELRAVASREGRTVAEDVVRTAGQPTALRLTDDPHNAPEAETRFVVVEAVDAKGTPCPLAKDRVAFALEGPGEIVAVGNGNPRGYDSFKAVSSHPLHYGKCVAVVRRTGRGPLTLAATGTGLRGVQLLMPDASK